MSKYKVGMVLGKFYPFHNGHAYLIGQASEQCDDVYVFCCTLPGDKYKGEDRFNWMRQHYEGSNVHVIWINEVLPQEPKDHPDFWNIWVNVVKSRVSDVEAIFTSEDYGTPFAKHLGVEHICVDKQRVHVPISGTMCRDHIYEQWKFLPKEVQDHFRRKVCVVGPESCGKSTMVQQLADHFNGQMVEEYGRTYVEGKDTWKLTAEDFLHIAAHQRINEEVAERKSSLLFCDTDVITTQIFYQLYCIYGSLQFDPDFVNTLNDIIALQDYDLYILLAPTVPHVQDGQRDFGNDTIRQVAFKLLEKRIKMTGIQTVTITDPDFSTRFEQAKNAVQQLIDDLR